MTEYNTSRRDYLYSNADSSYGQLTSNGTDDYFSTGLTSSATTKIEIKASMTNTTAGKFFGSVTGPYFFMGIHT